MGRRHKLIINVALTGNVPTKELTPHVPISPEEIADDAKKVYDLGASIVHIHARDSNGCPTYKKEIFREIILRIREKCEDVIITVSTSGRKVKDVGKRLEVIELDGDAKPDMASLTLGSMNFINDASVNHPRDIIFMLKQIREAGLKPELEIFDTGMVNYADYLFKKKYLEGVNYANLIFGSLGTMPATPKSLINIVEELGERMIWAASGIGSFAFQIQCLAVAVGGHVRVGVEDSIYMNGSRELATNQKLVARVRKVAEALEREIMTVQEVRQNLGIS